MLFLPFEYESGERVVNFALNSLIYLGSLKWLNLL